MELSRNGKICSSFSSEFSESTWNIEYFETKDEAQRWFVSEVICFWNYSLQKAALIKSLKSLVLEHLWTVNILKGPKHCFNLHGRIFVIFLDHSETKLAWKIFFQ